jgi:hypothetical protein
LLTPFPPPDGDDENKLKLVGLITPDIPPTGPMFVYVNNCFFK